MNNEENKSKVLRDSIDRMADELAKVIKTAQSAYDRIAHVELREGSGAAWRMLCVAVCNLRHTLRPKPGTAAFLTEITDYYCEHEPRLRLMPESEKPGAAPREEQKKPEVFHTPKELLDFGTANPPLGEIKYAPTPIDPSAPEMVSGGMRPKTDEDHMSRPEAAHILCRMATSHKVDVKGVVALQMGVKTLLKRHFDNQRNKAKRRARAANAERGDLCHED